MAVRLSVVMVHRTLGTPAAERIAQQVVGELIGLHGIDLVLIAPLESLEKTSTDWLTLSSIQGDLAILDWQTPAAMQQNLDFLGVLGTRALHAADAGAPAVASPSSDSSGVSRRLYFFDLNGFATAEAVVSSIAELNAARSVRTFSLGEVVSRSNAVETAQADQQAFASESESPDAQQRMTTQSTPLDPSVTDERNAEHARAEGSADSVARNVPEGTRGLGEDNQNLDALIDELDQLDL